MRIALGGIATESCTFSPLPTRRADFRVLRGVELPPRYPFIQPAQTVTVPLLFARALPGGPVEAETYRALKDEFLDALSAALPLDGLYLDLHGAMYVQGLEDAEADWIAAARDVVGPQCLIAASFDLHGNLSARSVELLDMLAAFRTAPHVDAEATRAKAWAMLTRCAREGLRPLRAWTSVPVALPGEVTSTEWDPGASLYGELRTSDGVPGVLDASILIGYAWADEPRTGASVVVTGMNRASIEGEASRLARRFWDVRREFRFGVTTGSVDECIRLALAAPEPCVFISDSGDNPTAGGAGDVPIFLGRLFAAGVQNALVAGLADAPAVAACRAAGVGATVRLSLGGKLDPITSPPLDATVRVLHVLDEAGDGQALIQVAGVKVIVTERRRPFHHVADMQRLGVEPLACKLVVIKIGYLEPDLKKHAPATLLALSPGAVNQDIVRLPFRRVRRPLFPLDSEMPQPRLMTEIFG
jgi:microcystin degradation protein MlrC